MAQVNWDEPEPPELAKPEPTFSDVFLVIYGYIIYLYNVISTTFFLFDHTEKTVPRCSYSSFSSFSG